MKKTLLTYLLIFMVGGITVTYATEDVHKLIHQLRSGDIDEKEHAAQALAEMGPAAEPAISALQTTLNDDLPYVRIRSAEALAKIGMPALPALIHAMKNVNGEVRSIAAKGLGQWGQNDEAAITALTNALHDRELQVRGAAALALGELGTSAESAIPALREAAKDADASVAAKAEEALTRVSAVTIGKKEVTPPPVATWTTPPPETPMVKPALPTKKTPAVHPKVAKKPKAVPPPPPPPPPTPEALMQQLQSPDIFARADAEAAIVRRSSETTPLVIQALESASTTQTELYIDLLTKIGSDDSKKALESYQKRQGDKKMRALLRDLRQEGKPSEDAANALVALGAPAVLPVSQVLSDPKVSSRQAASKVLNRLGTLSAPATNALITALDDPDSVVRIQSAVALSSINSPEAQKALRYFPIKDKIHRLLAIFHH
jgi:HEAT repeat protein